MDPTEPQPEPEPTRVSWNFELVTDTDGAPIFNLVITVGEHEVRAPIRVSEAELFIGALDNYIDLWAEHRLAERASTEA